MIYFIVNAPNVIPVSILFISVYLRTCLKGSDAATKLNFQGLCDVQCPIVSHQMVAAGGCGRYA
jgi:hypothetical protein